MKILIAQNYFRPHLNGMVTYAHRIAKGLVRRGHEVTLLTARHSKELAPHEIIDGIRIVRVPVWARVGKASIAPALLTEGAKWIAQSDILNLHVPHEGAAALALLLRFFPHKPLVMTYHCDLSLPAGGLNRVLERVVTLSNDLAARRAGAIVHATHDYAAGSSFLSRWSKKLVTLLPPVEVAACDAERRRELALRWNAHGVPTIGFVGRFAHEKGLKTLFAAMPRVIARIPHVKLLIAGPTAEVLGERLWESSQATLQKLGANVAIVGVLPENDMGAFYSLCDVIASPSDNPSETFGLTQAEAMSCGTPVVVSDIRGMRVPVRLTGMGKLVPPRNVAALARALIEVLESRRDYSQMAGAASALFNSDRAVLEFEKLCQSLLGRKPAGSPRLIDRAAPAL